MEEVVNALSFSFNGDPIQIQQAQNFLSSCSNNPEYYNLLTNIIQNSSSHENIKIAASIQLKYFILKSNDELSLENIISFIGKFPFFAQLQIIPALKYKIETIFKKIQGIQYIVKLFFECANSGFDYYFLSLIILKTILKFPIRMIPGIGDKSSLAKHILPIFQKISCDSCNSPNEYLIHLCLLTANRLLSFCNLEPFDFWINLILYILQNYSQCHIFNIDKDAVKLAVGVIELKQNIFMPESAFLVFNGIITNMKISNNHDYQNQIFSHSYKCINYSLRYFYQFINFEPYLATINLLDFIQNFIFYIFVLTENDFIEIKEDLSNFLMNRFIFDPYELFITPLSGARAIISQLVKKNICLEELANFTLSKIVNLSKDGEIFGATFLASILSKKCGIKFIELIINELNKNENNEKNLRNYEYSISLYMFLSNINYQNTSILIQCFRNLINDSVPEIVQFFSLLALPNLSLNKDIFKFLKKNNINYNKEDYYIDQEEIGYVINIFGNNLQCIIENSFKLGIKFTVKSLSKSIQFIIVYFLPFIQNISVTIINGLFLLFWNLASQNSLTSEFNSAILYFSRMMNFFSNDNELKRNFYSTAITLNLKMLTEISPSFYHFLLDILKGLVYYSPVFFSVFFQIPQILGDLLLAHEDEFLFDCFTYVVDILKYIALKFMKEYNMNVKEYDKLSFSISSILKESVNYCTNNFEDVSPNFITSINKLSQVLFIILKNQNFFPMFLELFTNINEPSFSDSIAALAALFPETTFSNDINFKLFINFSSPAIFLYVSLIIFQNFDKMPPSVVQQQDIIKENIIKKIDELQNEMNGFSDIIDLPNIDENEFPDEEEDNISDDDLSSQHPQNDPDIFNFLEILNSFHNLMN